MIGRKLASIQRIVALDPIENADRIVRATVLGWNVVVRNGEFSVGDRCVFFEIDSVLPSTASWSAFLKDRSYRVSTTKFRGVISQGLALPLSILQDDKACFEVGDDVTELLGVVQWMPPDMSEVEGGKSVSFPPGVPKSHATRLQSCPEVLEELKGVDFIVTAKCDGKSATYVKRHGELLVASHEYGIERADNVFWMMADKYNFMDRLRDGFAVQGEICGPGIAGNPMQLEETMLLVFDVFDLSVARYLDYIDMVEFCYEDNGRLPWLRTAPRVVAVVHSADGYMTCVDSGGTLNSFLMVPFPFKDTTLEWFLELAGGTYKPYSDAPREGIVVRPMKEMVSEALGYARLQFKVHSTDYLLRRYNKKERW